MKKIGMIGTILLLQSAAFASSRFSTGKDLNCTVSIAGDYKPVSGSSSFASYEAVADGQFLNFSGPLSAGVEADIRVKSSHFTAAGANNSNNSEGLQLLPLVDQLNIVAHVAFSNGQLQLGISAGNESKMTQIITDWDRVGSPVFTGVNAGVILNVPTVFNPQDQVSVELNCIPGHVARKP